MENIPDYKHRRSIRLKGYDYSQAGLYFITICAQNRVPLFGEIEDGEMVLNDAGKMINNVWNEIPVFYNNFVIDAFQIMPNHIHGIIKILKNPNPVGAGPCACPDNEWQPGVTGQPQGVAPTMSLSDIVQRFKTLTTKKYIDGVKQNNWKPFDKKLWQRNYYEHVIRNEESYCQLSEYIQTNPMKWQDDEYYH